MNQIRVSQLAKQFDELHRSMLAFAESCPAEIWSSIVKGEGWSVGTVIRHIVVAHYGWFDLVKKVVHKQELPDLSNYNPDMENAKHAIAYANPEKNEVIGILDDKGNEISLILKKLSDDQLDLPLYFQPIRSTLSIERFITAIVLESSQAHFTRVKAVR
jgi:uncharacterized damage-inducible protein DinB